jgi:hypothetical protein
MVATLPGIVAALKGGRRGNRIVTLPWHLWDAKLTKWLRSQDLGEIAGKIGEDIFGSTRAWNCRRVWVFLSMIQVSPRRQEERQGLKRRVDPRSSWDIEYQTSVCEYNLGVNFVTNRA